MKVRVLHFADLHVGEYPGPVVDGTNGRLQDTLNMLDHMAGEAAGSRCHLAVFAGDAFKTRRPPFRDILQLANGLTRLAEVVPTVAIPGNHDTPNDDGAGPWDVIAAMHIPRLTVQVWPASAIVDTRAGMVEVFALPYCSRSALLRNESYRDLSLEQINLLLVEKQMDFVRHFAAQRDMTTPSILVAHTSVTGAELSGGQNIPLGSEPVLSAAELEALGFDYVALGHIHKAQRLSPRVWYSGSPERIDFGEANEPKGYCVVEVEPGVEPQVEFCGTPARRFIAIEGDLQSVEDIGPWYERLAGTCGDQWLILPDTMGAVVRVRYRAPEDVAKAVNHQEILRRLNQAGAYYIASIQAEVERVNRARDQEVTEAMGVGDALRKYLAQNGLTDDGLTELAQQLLQEVTL